MEIKWLQILHNNSKVYISENYEWRRKWRGMFGLEPCLVEFVWDKIKIQATTHSPRLKEINLLWALNFLRVYDTEDRNAEKWGIRERKTLRIKVWAMTDIMHARLQPAVTFYFCSLVF